MEITWYGEDCFGVETKEALVVFNPGEKRRDLKTKADILIISNGLGTEKKTAFSSQKRTPKIIDGPGEYEISGIMIEGIPAKTAGKEMIAMFTLRAEGICLAHLSKLKQKELSESQLSELNGVDILLVPVGGKYTLTGKEAEEIVSEIDPRIVIPMYYKIGRYSKELSPADEFFKAEGVKERQARPLLKIEKKKLPVEEREVVILEPK